MSKLLIDRKLLERLQERLDPHIDARDWGMVCDAFRATHPAPASVGGEKMRERFSQIENEIMAGKHTASSVFTQMRTAALYMAATVPAGSRVVPVELLERITRKFSPQWHSLNRGQAIRELRALLEVKE